MKVVFDTNTLISGFLTATGISQSVLTIALKRHTVVLSEFILHELEEKLHDKIQIPERVIRRAINLLRRRSTVLKVETNLKLEFSDVDDIPILSLVEAAKPHYFITGDKKLLAVKKLGQTLFISLREALETL